MGASFFFALVNKQDMHPVRFCRESGFVGLRGSPDGS